MTEPLHLNLPTPEGAAMGRELARFADIEEAKLSAAGNPVPKRCVDCAARLGTLPNQCESTLLTLIACTMTDGEEFMCHLAMSDGEPTKVCRGYELLTQGITRADARSVVEAAYPEGLSK